MSKFPEEVGQVIEVQIKDHGIKNCKTLMLLLLLLLLLFFFNIIIIIIIIVVIIYLFSCLVCLISYCLFFYAETLKNKKKMTILNYPRFKNQV